MGSQGTTQLQGQVGTTDPQTSGVDADQPAAAVSEQVSTSDIQRVQNYIERCLQMYLSQKEVMPPMKAPLHASLILSSQAACCYDKLINLF